ncbi:hypothetical protein RclHR1_05220002 [Rhizophagus clarus]|uniref:F-box domain-containing protein n=1 Tax=Rhizophagus clarus TaxID=94130 RepID=A0A2Z6RYX5_9GLOM|nr:hypothetical protein RclHR1_05220002 [Rhizophagus clarus]GES79152.1 hypothetical protein GLOIN_2v1882635 [Rhizophagus clarus]
MACSKICSGNLIELTNEIIQYFKDDISTLYSCILVSRIWCRLSVPLLWEEPFLNSTQNYHFIKILLHNLNENDKAQLNEKYQFNDIFSNTLFNYPAFIKRLNTRDFKLSVENWVTKLTKKFVDSTCFTSLICKLLVKILIENEANLHSFEIVLSTSNIECLEDIFESILGYPRFVYNIRNLTLDLNLSPDKIDALIPILNLLVSNCSLITYFKINGNPVKDYFSEMIISQRDLKKISFESNEILYKPFLSLKNSNCSNTLNTIIFCTVDLEQIVDHLKEGFNNLNVLESIHILYCYSLNSKFVQQMVNIAKPFKLKTLFMFEILLQDDSVELLLKKFGNDLENFAIDYDFQGERKQIFLQSIEKYCRKIRCFSFGHDIDTIYQGLDIIMNNIQNINYLYIEFDLDPDNYLNAAELSSTILVNLGQILPSKLEYLSLELCPNISDLEIFLVNIQDTFIRKLLIKTLIVNDLGDILSYLKEYIMKKKMVEYLAYLECGESRRIMDDGDLFSLKDEVNEFNLHNIKVLGYKNLYLYVHDYDHIINLQ